MSYLDAFMKQHNPKAIPLPTKRFPSVGEVASALGCTTDELLALSDEDCAELVWYYTETIPFTYRTDGKTIHMPTTFESNPDNFVR